MHTPEEKFAMSEKNYLYDPFTAATLVDLLCAQADELPDKLAYCFLVAGGEQELHLTYRELDQQARAIAARLQALQCVGERVLLFYPPGLGYIAAFFGCLYAGAVAVPCYPPRVKRADIRLQAIAVNAQAKVILSTQKLSSYGEQWSMQMPELEGLHWLLTEEIDISEAISWQRPAINSQTLAFLQYTSGSTGFPKGVRLNHGNLLHNLSWIREYFNIRSTSSVVSWLPPYHDMGLIGGILQPLYSAIPVTLFSPTAFLEQPLRWLDAISRTHATVSGAPNFAFDLCVHKTTELERAKLDLSSWEVAFSGAEPLRAETLEEFAKVFEPCGFRREALYPCYGLAEATLFVSGSQTASFPIVRNFATEILQGNQVHVATPTHQSIQTLIGCGTTIPDQTTIIVDPVLYTSCSQNQVGEIWIAGPSVAQGYWQQPTETEQTFGAHLADGNGPFLRTGDLGFIDDSQLFITGRLKDLIIIRGRNYYPQDIELTVERSHPALRLGSCAAFSIEVAGEERLVVVQEPERQSRHASIEEIAAAIRRRVAEEHELHVYAVVLIKPGSLPKTSSGKVQRRHCRTLFLEQRLPAISESLFTGESRGVLTDTEDEVLLSTLKMTSEPDARRVLIVRFLQKHIARLLGMRPGSIDVRQPLTFLGIDSLMTVELKNSLETALGVVISMNTLLEGLSVAELAETILAQHTYSSASEVIAPTPTGLVPTRFPLSSNQRALWFLYQLLPDDMAYIIMRCIRLRGTLDQSAFQRAWQKLVQYHPSLRTVFSAIEGEPVQEVCQESSAFFFVEDVSAWGEERLHQRLLQEAQRPFDLEHGPLLRVFVFSCSAQEHILFLLVHHIIVDLWSLIVLLRELKDLYYDECNGGERLPALPAFSYYDYVRWQSEMLKGSSGEQSWSYWQKQLARCRPLLELPTDQPRHPIKTRQGATFFFTLAEPLSRQLKKFAGTHHTTLYTMLMAAFCTLLYHYTEQSDMLIGTSIAGRNRAAFMDLVGYFVNPLPIRAKLGDDLTFMQLLEQMRETILSAFAFQDFPFVELVNRLRPERNAGRPPLFQVMFTFQQAPSNGEDALAALALGTHHACLNWGEISLEPLAFEQKTAQFDLLLMMAEAHGELIGSFQYDANLFFASTIERLATHFQTLLENLLANPEQHLADIRILPRQESHQLLIEWNATKTAYPRELSLQSLFEIQVERHPGQIAVGYGDQSLTYDQLNRRANQLAQRLRKLGVGPEVGVGLCLERSLDLVVGIWGILKAGGYYVPLDPQYPPARLAFMLADAQVTLALTHQHWLEHLISTNVRTLCLDTDWTAISTESDANLVHKHIPELLAYVIYTSGSTGLPKGVMIAHNSLVNYLTWCQQAYPLRRGQEVPVHSSVAFDLTVTSLLAPLLAGQKILLFPEEQQLDLLAESFRQGADFSLIKLTPLHLQLLGEQLAETHLLGRTHAFVIGGEALLSNHIAFWQSVAPDTELINEYGPTETTVGCCVYRVPADDSSESAIPIGRPIANTHLYILNRSLQPVPIGVAGDLYIGGVGVARGYYNRPDLTAEKFLPDPFSSGHGARMYKTGDRVRYRADSTIEYLGRSDHQVKIRGFRIELEEIEVVLARYPEVQHAVVLAYENGSDAQQLAACIVATPGQTISLDSLRIFLREHLPDYMVPATFLLQTAFPLTSNGKVDRYALAHMLPRIQHRQLNETETPRTEREQIISNIWKTILKIDQVGIHENFFDLGGHSLLMVQMQRHLKEHFAREVSLLEIMKHPTIHALATSVYQASHSDDKATQFSMQQSKARAENRLATMQLRQNLRKNRK